MSLEKFFKVEVKPNAVIDELKDIVDIRFIKEKVENFDDSGSILDKVKNAIKLGEEISEAFQYEKIIGKMNSEQIIEKGVKCLDALFSFSGFVGKIVENFDDRFFAILLTTIYESIKNKYNTGSLNTAEVREIMNTEIKKKFDTSEI